MILKAPHLLTKIEIWSPRYKDGHTELAEPVVLLSKNKVGHATPFILVEFTKAKHLMGQRFGILRTEAESCPVDSNGKIECYAVPLSKFEGWTTVKEEYEIINSFGW